MDSLDWKKSSYSHTTGNCVEVADLPGGQVGVRDSQNRRGDILRVAPEGWAAFVNGVRVGILGSR